MTCLCNNTLKSTSVVLTTGTKLVINVGVSSTVLLKNNVYDVIICQSIPSGTTTERVYIKTTDNVEIPMFSMNGNYLRTDQIRTRRVYPAIYGNDPKHFSLAYPIKCSAFAISNKSEDEDEEESGPNPGV